jgi:hypothetical protein
MDHPNVVLSKNPIDGVTECLFFMEGWISDLPPILPKVRSDVFAPRAFQIVDG